MQLWASLGAGFIYFPDLFLPFDDFLDFVCGDFGLIDSPFFA